MLNKLKSWYLKKTCKHIKVFKANAMAIEHILRMGTNKNRYQLVWEELVSDGVCFRCNIQLPKQKWVSEWLERIKNE